MAGRTERFEADLIEWAIAKECGGNHMDDEPNKVISKTIVTDSVEIKLIEE